MQTKTIVPDSQNKRHHIHLAALGAPTLNVPVQFADEASKVFSAYRDRYEFGASEMKAACGNIYDSRNRIVGRISYNGRIWTADGRPVTGEPPFPKSAAPSALHLIGPDIPKP